jgi:hypothetical protein
MTNDTVCDISDFVDPKSLNGDIGKEIKKERKGRFKRFLKTLQIKSSDRILVIAHTPEHIEILESAIKKQYPKAYVAKLLYLSTNAIEGQFDIILVSSPYHYNQTMKEHEECVEFVNQITSTRTKPDSKLFLLKNI